MGYTTIGQALFDILDALVGSALKIAYNYEPKTLEKYPSATVVALSHSNVYNDTAANRREMVFTIRIYYRTEETDYENAMRASVDTIIESIEADPTLGGACDFAEPTESRWLFQEREVPVRVCEMTINCIFRKNR